MTFGELSLMAYISSPYLPSEVSNRVLRVPTGSAAIPHCWFSHLCFRLAQTRCSCGILGLTAGQELWEGNACPYLMGAVWKLRCSALLLNWATVQSCSSLSHSTAPNTCPAPEPASWPLPCLDVTSLHSLSWAQLAHGETMLSWKEKGRAVAHWPVALCSHLHELGPC